MKTVTLETQSYLYENAEGKFRAVPFSELSIEEWIVYENEVPKYLIDFNRRTSPLIIDFVKKIKSGDPLEEVVQKLGRFLGKQWTTENEVNGNVIPNSQEPETITLILLDNLADHFIDLYFIATNEDRYDALLNEEMLIETFVNDTSSSGLSLESSYIGNFNELKGLLSYLFKQEITFRELASNEDKQIFDLTEYKNNCITLVDLENSYLEWLNKVEMENTIDAYGNLIGIIGYIHRNIDKKNLVLLAEKRKHWG